MGGPRSVLAVAAAACCAVVLSAQQEKAADLGFRLRFAQSANLSGLYIQYFVRGSFGIYNDFVRTQPHVREYAMRTRHRGQEASSLKALIYCPGYRMVLVTDSALGERRARILSVTLEELGSLPLAGRVISVPTPRGLSIKVEYQAYWAHGYFELSDGPMTSFIVASTTLAADGSFSVNVPDFARDPVVASQGQDNQGVFRLRVREAGTGNIPYALEEIQQAGTGVRLPIATEYPQDLVLVGVPR